MKDKPSAQSPSPPSAWTRRMHAKLKRVLARQIETLERRTAKGRGPKPWSGKKRKPAPGKP